MTKSIRIYDWQYSGEPAERGGYEPGREDNTLDFLAEQSITANLYSGQGDFLWFHGDGVLLHINTSWQNYGSEGRKIHRYLTVQIQPPNAALPKELSDFIEEKGFKQIDAIKK